MANNYDPKDNLDPRIGNVNAANLSLYGKAQPTMQDVYTAARGPSIFDSVPPNIFMENPEGISGYNGERIGLNPRQFATPDATNALAGLFGGRGFQQEEGSRSIPQGRVDFGTGRTHNAGMVWDLINQYRRPPYNMSDEDILAQVGSELGINNFGGFGGVGNPNPQKATMNDVPAAARPFLQARPPAQSPAPQVPQAPTAGSQKYQQTPEEKAQDDALRATGQTGAVNFNPGTPSQFGTTGIQTTRNGTMAGTSQPSTGWQQPQASNRSAQPTGLYGGGTGGGGSSRSDQTGLGSRVSSLGRSAGSLGTARAGRGAKLTSYL